MNTLDASQINQPDANSAEAPFHDVIAEFAASVREFGVVWPLHDASSKFPHARAVNPSN
jgi:hypothetical protein